MPSKEEIESSRIPTSLFLLSTILLRATTRTTLEDKHEEEDEEEDEDREEVEAVEKGEHGKAVEKGEEGELHREGDRKSVRPPFPKARSAPELLAPALAKASAEAPSPAPAEAPAEARRIPILASPAPPASSRLLLPPQTRPLTRARAAAAEAARLLPIAPAPAPAPAEAARLLPIAPAPAPAPAEAARLLPIAPAPAPAPAPASAAGLLTTIREESRGSIESISEERELQELLYNLDAKFLDNVEILKILKAIDTIIDTEDISSLDKINKTLQPYGITITPDNISINIAQEK